MFFGYFAPLSTFFCGTTLIAFRYENVTHSLYLQMVDSWWSHPDVNRVDKKRLYDSAHVAHAERQTPIQLRARQPQFLVGVNPHGIHPQQPVILQECCPGSVRGHLFNGQPVRITNIYTPFCVDGRPARRGCQRKGLHVRRQDRSKGRVVKGLVQVRSFYPEHTP